MLFERRERGGRVLLRTLTLSLSVTVAWGVLYYAFGALLVPLERDLSCSRSMLTLTFSFGLVVSALCAGPVGRVIDTYGPRAAMTFGALLGTAALWWWAHAGSVAELFGVFGLIGVAQACVLYDPAFIALTRWHGPTPARAKAMLLLTTVGGTASLVFVPLTTALADRFDHHVALLVLCALFAAVVIPVHATLPRGEHTRAAPASGPAPSIALLAAVFAIPSFVSTALAVHLVAFLQERELPPLLVGLMGVAQIPGRWWFVRFRPSTALLLFIQALALAGVLSDIVPLLVLSLLVYGAANGMLTLARADAALSVEGDYGTVLARMSSWSLVAKAIAPFAAGVVRDVTGDYRLLLILFVALTIAASAGARREPDV